MHYAVIMAGGSGKRLWPLSRQKRPKQVLRLIDGQTLLRKCYNRLEGVFDAKHIIVLTNSDFVETVRDELPELPDQNVIAEPVMRDTAGAVGLAATILYKNDPDATMAVVTADQLLEPAEPFKNALRSALSFVEENPETLITFGIKPLSASTQFGYIKFGDQEPCEKAKDPVHRIEAFREKPDQQTAEDYFSDDSYSWNSGLFVWRCDTILENLKRFAPDFVQPLEKIALDWPGADAQQLLNQWFPRLPKVSIDYAVMEKAENVCGIVLDCKWHDLGSFESLREILEPDPKGNVTVCKYSEFLDSSANVVVTESQEHLIAMIGVDNMVVVHSPDATLIFPIDQAGRLKELLEIIKAGNKKKFI